MRRKIILGLASLFIILAISSCTVSSQRDYLDQYEIQKLIDQAIKDNNSKLEITQWKIIPFEIKAKDWKWNDEFAQWEVFGELPELTEFIYEKGIALGYIFLGTPGKDEVQKMLPYVETIYDGDDDAGNPIIFTETISCDFQFGKPSTVGFTIKASDLYDDPNAPADYNFRVVLLW